MIELERDLRDVGRLRRGRTLLRRDRRHLTGGHRDGLAGSDDGHGAIGGDDIGRLSVHADRERGAVHGRVRARRDELVLRRRRQCVIDDVPRATAGLLHHDGDVLAVSGVEGHDVELGVRLEHHGRVVEEGHRRVRAISRPDAVALTDRCAVQCRRVRAYSVDCSLCYRNKTRITDEQIERDR